MNTVPMKKEDLRASGPAAHAASEGSLVEQQRAIAQVQGALVVAQQRPRDEIAARDRMEAVCQLDALAEMAFFRYGRGGSQITGPSIHLARELARCWGNIDYGITELRRDDRKGESEMLAHAWDLETNARTVNSFIVPHKRDKRGGPEALTDMRDIYENNANAGARRVRECIFAVLPKSYVEAAKAMCLDTLENGGGEPIEERRTKMLQAFNKMGVDRKRIEKKMGRPADKLTAFDLGTLRVVYGSIARGEASVTEEFPTDASTEVAEQLAPKAKPAPETPEKPQEPPAKSPAGESGTSSQTQVGDPHPVTDAAAPGAPLEFPVLSDPPTEMEIAAWEKVLKERLAGITTETAVMDFQDTMDDTVTKIAKVDRKAAVRIGQAFDNRVQALVGG